MPFETEIAEEITKIRLKYPDTRSALMPVLHIAQRQFGWLSEEAVIAVSDTLDLPKATVRGVATFYTLYKNKPCGKHLVQLCTNIACMLFEAETLVDILKDKYGLEPGGTSPDGRFSLVIMECIGLCDKAPAMLVNTDVHTDLDPKRITEVLDTYKL